MSRRKARECAFKVVFQVDQVNAEPRDAFRYLLKENDLPEKDRVFSWELIEKTLSNLENIDARISRFARDWSIERMSSVDRNIMRLAICELLYIINSEPVVAINEAIEIAKQYGEDSSGGFINAILDRVWRDN
ncbi:transcription antitermination factor NusB [Syntrophomonas erecta]